MKHYFNSLNERERWMVIGTALCVFIYVYYLFLYSPLSNHVTLKSTQLIEKTKTLAWMKTVRPSTHSPQTRQTVDNSQLLSLLASKLKEDSTLKFPYQLQQTGSGDIQLTFDEVPFKAFIRWFAKINERYAITIKQFDAEQSKTPGVIRLMIILSAA